jgi:hypothetical protein
VIQRAFSGKVDLRAMAALVRDFPADNLHVADLFYRFSSWAFDYPDNVGLWVDADGQLLAWAVMQMPFWMIDYAFHPGADRNLRRQVLDWADRRACRVLDTKMAASPHFVYVGSAKTSVERPVGRLNPWAYARTFANWV